MKRIVLQIALLLCLYSNCLADDAWNRTADIWDRVGDLWSRTGGVTPTSDLILQYLFGANGSESTITLDTSGNAYTGTVVNAVWNQATNGITDYYSFANGTTDYIEAEGVEEARTKITVSCWAMQQGGATAIYDSPFSRWDADTDKRAWSLVTWSSEFPMTWSLNADTISVASPNNVPDSVWVHYIGTYDGTNAILYENGLPVGTNSGSGLIYTNSQTITIATFRDELDIGMWTGKIWGNEILTNALTASEVLATNRSQAVTLGIMDSYVKENHDDDCVLWWQELLTDGSTSNQALSTASAPTVGGSADVFLADFNGSANFISVADSTSMGVVSNFSFGTWIKPKETTRGDFLGRWGSGTADQKYLLTHGITASKFTFYTRAGSYVFIDAPTTYNTNQWYHVVGTIGSTTFKLYIDGVPVGTNTMPTGLSPLSTDVFRIGKSGAGFHSFSTMSKAFKINKLLSDAEILGIYNAQTNFYSGL